MTSVQIHRRNNPNAPSATTTATRPMRTPHARGSRAPPSRATRPLSQLKQYPARGTWSPFRLARG